MRKDKIAAAIISAGVIAGTMLAITVPASTATLGKSSIIQPVLSKVVGPSTIRLN